MIDFRASDPFPLIDLGAHSLIEVQNHSAWVDQWLGLQTESVERKLAAEGCKLKVQGSSGEKQQLWFGLAVQSLMTPYAEIRCILQKLQLRSGQIVVDMGAAYGRMGFVMARHFSEAAFIGYEYVGERVIEGQRVLRSLRIENASLEHCDLASSNFRPCEADVYFIYDFGTLKAIEKALHDLRRISEKKPIRVVARGRHCRYLIATRHLWLHKAQRSRDHDNDLQFNSNEASNPPPGSFAVAQLLNPAV